VNDADGRLVSREEIDGTANFTRQLDLTGYAAGTYYVTVSTPDGSRTVKVLKQ
jgi:hypothetical protein